LNTLARQRNAAVAGLGRSARHRFSKDGTDRLALLAGLGVDGDCHAGSTVQHLSRVRRDPGQPNLRQVHLMAAELYDELTEKGFELAPGQLGENVTTTGLDLLALARGTRLSIGAVVVLEVTGLRNPCVQIDRFRRELLAEVLYRDAAGQVVRRAGVMAVVVAGGEVGVGDTITVEPPPPPLSPLTPV
jgi:MOSC domain-containing protein YiiM